MDPGLGGDKANGFGWMSRRRERQVQKETEEEEGRGWRHTEPSHGHLGERVCIQYQSG